MTTDTPKGFKRRKGSRLLRIGLDLPESEAAEVAALAAEAGDRSGENVSTQAIARRAIRKGLPLVRAEVHPIGTADKLAGMPGEGSKE